MLLSIPELQTIFKDICLMNLRTEELIVLSKYLKERFFRQEIKKKEFDELLATNFPRYFNEEKAIEDLDTLKEYINFEDL